jgi:hypothetical protein
MSFVAGTAIVKHYSSLGDVLNTGDQEWTCTCSDCTSLIGTWTCPGLYNNTIVVTPTYDDDFTEMTSDDWIQVCLDDVPGTHIRPSYTYIPYMYTYTTSYKLLLPDFCRFGLISTVRDTVCASTIPVWGQTPTHWPYVEAACVNNPECVGVVLNNNHGTIPGDYGIYELCNSTTTSYSDDWLWIPVACTKHGEIAPTYLDAFVHTS